MPTRKPFSVRLTRQVFALCSLLLAATSASAASSHAEGPRAAIERELFTSAAGWSGGNLDAFLNVYEDSPETTYLNSDGVVRGFKAIRDMYATRFGGARGALGRLSLQVLAFRTLGPAYAEVIGRFTLHPAAGAADAHGLFTLVFHHTPAGWKIASDHTS